MTIGTLLVIVASTKFQNLECPTSKGSAFDITGYFEKNICI